MKEWGSRGYKRCSEESHLEDTINVKYHLFFLLLLTKLFFSSLNNLFLLKKYYQKILTNQIGKNQEIVLTELSTSQSTKICPTLMILVDTNINFSRHFSIIKLTFRYIFKRVDKYIKILNTYLKVF